MTRATQPLRHPQGCLVGHLSLALAPSGLEVAGKSGDFCQTAALGIVLEVTALRQRRQ